LIGFHGKVASSNTADYLSLKRDKVMAMVRTLYVLTFTQNEDDIEGIDTALANATTYYSTFVSTGTAVKKKKKRTNKSSEPPSIFDLKDNKCSLCCIAAITVTAGKVHQFVH
jgi:hypothetical protein